MSDWNDVLQDIKRRYPFLPRMNVCGTGHYSSPLLGALQASTDIAGKLLDEETNFRRMAMIFPLLLDCPQWIAVGYSLSGRLISRNVRGTSARSPSRNSSRSGSSYRVCGKLQS